MMMSITLDTVEELSTLLLGLGALVIDPETSLSAHMTRLRGISWVHCPHTVLTVTKRLSHIPDSLNYLSPQVCVQ